MKRFLSAFLSVLRWTAYAILVLLVMLTAVEMVLKTVTKKKPMNERFIRLRESPVNMDRMWAVSAKRRQKTDNLKKNTVRFRTDENGFMRPSFVHDKADVTVFFIGGSTTFCIFVEEENRYPYLTGRLLEQKTGRKINSINAGVPGNHSMHSLNALINKVLPYEPDVAVLHHNINDLINLVILKSYWNDHFRRSMIVTPKSFSFYAFARFVRFSWFRCLFDILLESPFFEQLMSPYRYSSMDEFDAYRGMKADVDPKFITAQFGMSLRHFVDICRVRGVEPVLMTQANRLTDNPDPFIRQDALKIERDYGVPYALFKDLFGKMNDTIRRVGREAGVLVVDMDRLLPKDSDHMYDMIHYTDRASLIAAERLAEEILPLIKSADAEQR